MNVSISGLVIEDWQRPGTTGYLRFYYSDDWVDSDGHSRVAGAPGSRDFFQEVALTVNTTTKEATPTAGSVPLVSTTDARMNPDARVSCVVLDASRARISNVFLFSGWKVPHTYGASFSFADLADYNQASRRPPAAGHLDADQTAALVNSLFELGDPATALALGRVKMSVPPADPASPVAVGDNDPRVPPAGGTAHQFLTRNSGGTGYEHKTLSPGDGLYSLLAGTTLSLHAHDAGAAQKGAVRLSVPPASPTAPIAVGDNDPRLVQAFLDVRTFGAVGDGVTNDTAAIQAAHDAALAAVAGVYFPGGTYSMTTLNWNPRVPLAGVGYDQVDAATGAPTNTGTTLRSRSAAPLIQYVTTTDVSFAPGTIRDMTLDGNSVGTVGLNMRGIQRFKFSRLFIRRFVYGVHMLGSLMGSFQDCIINTNQTGVYIQNATQGAFGNMQANFYSFSDCYLQANAGWAIDFRGGSQLLLRDCDFELNGTAGDATTGTIKVTGASPAPGTPEQIALRIEGGWAEHNEGFAFLRLNLPAQQFVRTVISGFTHVLGGNTHGVWVDGSNALYYQFVTLINSNMSYSATSDITVSGVEAFVTLYCSRYQTKTIPPGANFEAHGDELNGNTLRSLFFARSECAEGGGVQLLPTTGAADFHWTLNARTTDNGATWNREDTTSPAWNMYFSAPDNAMYVRFAAAGSNPIAWTTPFKIDTNAAADETPLLVRVNGSLKRVSVGAADSAGAGFRQLRVTN